MSNTKKVTKKPANNSLKVLMETSGKRELLGRSERSGRDEMNLVEYPFASLSLGASPGAVIENRWLTDHPSIKGKSVTASWRVAGDPELGLPTPLDEQVYLVLMEMTAERGWQQEVHFNQYEVLKRLGWSASKKYYAILRQCFQRLKAVNITAENCFYDLSTKSLKTVGFSLIDQYEISVEGPGAKRQDTLPLSYWRWNDIIYASMRANYIRPLDLDFALSLDRPLSLRLFRYLSKKRWTAKGPKLRYKESVHNLCTKHLGMTEAKFISAYKQRLAPAHAELIERGFLLGVEYEPGQEAEVVVYVFGSRLRPKQAQMKGQNDQETPTPSAAEFHEPEADMPEILAARQRYKDFYESLPEEAKSRLLEEAKVGVADFLWDRLTHVESPVSLFLWNLIERDYEDALTEAETKAEPEATKD
jgi:hypothetical protein